MALKSNGVTQVPDGLGSADQVLKVNSAGTAGEWGDAGGGTLASLSDTTVSTSDPAIDTNPSATGHCWVNKSSGECYICTDATTNDNVWTNIGAVSYTHLRAHET